MANVLFVCLHNAGRSQMSQALFERAGFIEAPVMGPPKSASRPIVPPIAIAAAAPAARVSVATAMITNMRKALRMVS